MAWWFNVGVQIFLCMSGFLYGWHKDIKNGETFIIRNFKKVLLDYYLYLLPVIPIYLIFAPHYLSSVKIIGSIFGSTNIDGLKHLWYVPYILFCYLITPILLKINEILKNKRAIIFIITIILLLAVNQAVITLYVKYFTAAWINCYLIGFFGAKLIKRGFSLNSIVGLLIPVCIALNAVKIRSPESGSLFIEQYAHAALGVSLFFCLFSLLKKIDGDNRRLMKLLNWTDRYSYDVYIVHHVYILGPFSVMALLNNKFLNIIIVYVLIILTAFILNQASGKCKRLTQ
jgi:peptidoglycan/LPS O-acetylase OafA/YrhL